MTLLERGRWPKYRKETVRLFAVGCNDNLPWVTPGELDKFIVECATKAKDEIVDTLEWVGGQISRKRYPKNWTRTRMYGARAQLELLCLFHDLCLNHGLEKEETAVALRDMCRQLAVTLEQAELCLYGFKADYPEMVDFPKFPKWPEEDDED